MNPDLLTVRIAQAEPDAPNPNLLAVQRIERWLRASIEVHQTIGVETVLSTGKYRKLVRRAKQRGFEIRLIYVIVDSVTTQIERVRLRVAKGGHHVPADKIAARRARSLAQLGWFFANADYVLIYVNSSAEPRVMVEMVDDLITVAADAAPEILDAIGIS